MLEFKNNPQQLMSALDDFLTLFWGEHKIQIPPESAIEISDKLPISLQLLYSFICQYPSPRNGRLFNIQDGLYINNDAVRCKGKFLIVGENQGVWSCGTDLVKDKVDPPVWLLGNEEGDSWEFVCDSLSQFIVTFILRETFFGCRYEHPVQLEQLANLGLEVTTLWSGTYAGNTYNRKYSPNAKEWIDKFYLVEDSFLVWNLRSSCGTNYKNASKLLDSLGFPRTNIQPKDLEF